MLMRYKDDTDHLDAHREIYRGEWSLKLQIEILLSKQIKLNKRIVDDGLFRCLTNAHA